MFAIVINVTLGVYKRVYLLINFATMRLKNSKKTRTRNVKMSHNFKNITAINVGIILQSVDIPITCLKNATSVKNIGIKRRIYMSELLTHEFETSLIK